eukprot:547453_1
MAYRWRRLELWMDKLDRISQGKFHSLLAKAGFVSYYGMGGEHSYRDKVQTDHERFGDRYIEVKDCMLCLNYGMTQCMQTRLLGKEQRFMLKIASIVTQSIALTHPT